MDSTIHPPAAPATILIVDDQAPNLLALEAILEPLGHRLLRASSGEEALRCVLNEDVALILLDVQMPGMDGFETASLLKARPRTRHIPIIFITALSRDAVHIFEGYKTGAVDYILKPFNADILRSKVSVFIELHLRGEEIKRQAALLQERAAQELERKIEHRFRALTDEMPLCVWATRPDGTVYYGNRIWQAYIGGTPEEGATCLDALHPEDLERFQEAWSNSLKTELPFELQYRILRHSDATYRWMLGRAAPERDEQGRLVGWIATATDIDDQKRAEEALAQLSEKEQQARVAAELANRMKDEFLATVSHELRTPLTAILGWSSVLRNGLADPAKLQHALDIIERNARAQCTLVEDLLDMSRVMSGKLKLNVRDVDLRSVVNAAVDTVRASAGAKQIDVSMSCCSLPLLRGDPDRLQQVVWNLVSNAVKFSPAGGRVLIETACGEGRVMLHVKDNGPGISAEALPHLFERFWQADSTSTRSSGGLGLGLAIVRQLVELHGGTVTASSAGLGQGATFTVELPMQVAAVPTPPAPSVSSAEPELQDVKVLLVEDDLDGREAITMMLETYGAHVTAVGSAAEAYASLQSARPHVLVSDIGMPQEDGYSLLRRVRALKADAGGDVPAAALSAYASEEDTRRALDAGFQAHLAKPVEPQKLALLVEQLVRGATVH